MALSPRVCDSLCQEGNCITHVCTRSTRDATNFKGRRCCKRLHRKKNSNNLRARELRKISWTVIIKMPSISWYENYDWHLSRRVGFSERNFSRAVCFPPIYKELPLFSNLRSPSGASLLTRAKPLVAFRTSDTRAILLWLLTNSLASTKLCLWITYARFPPKRKWFLHRSANATS